MGTIGEDEEILVFTDHDPILAACTLPQIDIIFFREAQIKNVDSVHVLHTEPTGYGDWKLIINQEFHDASARIAWSVWRAAYVSAAVMSSFSRNA